jgi:hydrogenase maturation protease
MDASSVSRHEARVLCLGNDILADDALGIRVAEELRSHLPESVDVVDSAESGLRLLDHLLDVPKVVVIDTVQTGRSAPGTIHELAEGSFTAVAGNSPHQLGLFDALALGRLLGMPVAEELVILAVEAADCCTLGGEMHPAVRDAIPRVVERARQHLESASRTAPA